MSKTFRKWDHGPFDIIGDVHGCCDELEELLAQLGYQYRDESGMGIYARSYFHPEQRKAVFVGDLVDRGPRILDTVQLVMRMVQGKQALCIPGNHDDKLMRKLQGRNVQINAGLDQSLAELEALPDELQNRMEHDVRTFLEGLPSHYILDDGKLVVAHAGIKEGMQGMDTRRVRDFTLFGETTGEYDEFGLPVRLNWARKYHGHAKVVYGHTPVLEAVWQNNTINIDTGCVFGGKLTALRYPELELVSVPARQVYSEPKRPIAEPPGLTDR